MVNFTILAGGFSTFIATYVFDSDAMTLSLVRQNDISASNPSWIALHPHNSSILYAVNEISPVGNLQSFSVDTFGGLTPVDKVATGGNGPTFTNPLSTGEVTAINFGSPNSAFIATVPDDPLHFERNSPIIPLPVQNGMLSNPHMSLEFNGEVFVPDLGADKIWRIVNTGSPGNFKVQGQINIQPGTGPRHIAIHGKLARFPVADNNHPDNILFTLHETASTLTAQLIPPAPNGTTFPLIASVSVVPSNPLSGSKFAAAEILISTPTDQFPDPLIYVSNRNIGNVTDPNGDTIAIFQFVNGIADTVSKTRIVKRSRNAVPQTGTFQLLAQVPTGLQQIRSMALGKVQDGGDQFIIAGANTQGGVAVFQRVDGGKNLKLVARNEDIANRTSFVFV